MKTKRTLALALCIVMMLALVPFSAFAADGLKTEGEKAEIVMEILKYKEEYSSIAPGEYGIEDAGFNTAAEPLVEVVPQSSFDDLQVGDRIMLGIKLRNMDRIHQTTDYGINAVTAVVKYDSAYVTPEDVASIKNNSPLRVGGRSTTALMSSRGRKYAFTDTLAVTSDEILVAVQAPSSSPNYYRGEDEQYIGIIDFELTAKPAAGAGAKAFYFGTANPEKRNVLNFGLNGNQGVLYSTNNSTSTNEMLNVVNFDASPANLFPDTFKLKYNDNTAYPTTLTPAGEAVAVKDGTSVDGDEESIVEDVAAEDAFESTVGAKDGKLNSGKTPLATNGYAFAGWYTDENCTDDNEFTVSTKATADLAGDDKIIDLYAKWVPGYNISFDPNGGQFADGSSDVIVTTQAKDVDVDMTNFPTADPTREFEGKSYDFKGWTTKANGEGETPITTAALKTYSYDKTSSVTFYAQWEVADNVDPEDKVTVIFDSNGGTPATAPTVTIVKGDKVGGAMPNNPTKTDYVFDYWSKNQNGAGKDATPSAVFDAATTVDADITVYAQWKGDPDHPENYATVTFTQGDGDTAPDPETKTVLKGEAIGDENMPTPPTKTGEAFDQWKVTASDDAAITVGSFLTGATEINGDVTVEPTFKNVVPVKFYPNNGQFAADVTTEEDGSYLVESLGANDAIPASVQPTVTREGYQFFYWNTQPDGFGDTVNADYKIPATPPADGVKLYAIWNAATPDPTDPENPPTTDETTGITVTFNGNGGTPATADRYLNVNDTKLEALMSAMPVATRDKYKNIGWNTTAGGTGDSVAIDTDLTTLSTYNSTNKTITLYAQWEADPDDPDVNEEDIIDVEVYQNKSDMDAGDNTKAIATYKVVSGDKLTALDTPVVEGMTFAGWKKGADNSAFDITADTITVAGDPKVYKIYATWTASVNIVVEEFETTYNGEVQGIKVTKVVLATDDTKDLTDSVGTPIITYTQGTDTTPVQPQDAGDYKFVVSFADTGITVGGYIYSKDQETAEPTFKIKKAKLSVTKKTGENVAGKEQSYKISETEAEGYIGFVPEVTATLVKNDEAKTEVPVNLAKDTDFTVQYSDKFTNDSDWNAAERTFVTTVPKGNDAIGKYTVKIVLGTEIAKNYEIDTVGQYINTYYAADAEPAPTGAQKAEAIKFDVTPDIELTGLVVKSGKGDDKTAYTTDAPTYSDDTYATEKPIVLANNDTYFIKAGIDEDVVLIIEGTLDSEKSEITINGTKVTLPEKETTGDNAGKYVVGPIELNPADGTGANNEIKVVLNKDDIDDATGQPKAQTIKAVQLVAPKITLNYGNSPYGEIMKAFANETVEIDGVERNKAEAAKEAFAANNNKYDSALIPPNAVDKTDMYPRYAWVDIQNAQELTEEEKEALANPDINIDVNDYAIFIYNGKPFIDPGFVATDSMGKPVENLARTFKGAQRLSALNAWTAMADANVQAQADIAIAAAPSNAKIEDITKAFVDGQMDSYPIRPNVYNMEYSFEDENGGTVTVTRKVVVLQSEGDTDFSYGINDNDLVPITVRIKAAAQFDIITDPVARRVYEYRCLDLMDFEAINDNDKVPVVKATKTKTQPATRYVPLEENAPVIE